MHQSGPRKRPDEVMTRLGEIDQKLEHVIENITDTLYRCKPSDREDREVRK